MTQILLYQTEKGIALATDSRAVTFAGDENAAADLLQVEKLFQLSASTIMVTGGAGYGLLVCRKFQEYVWEEGCSDFEGIIDLALPFFHSEIRALRHKNLFIPKHPDLDRLYILIAGHQPRLSDNPFPCVLLVSEHGSDPLHVAGTGRIVAIPRQLGIEYRLSRLPASDTELNEAESLFQSLLEKLALAGDDVGPPFYFVQITSEGISIREQRDLESRTGEG